MKNPTDISALPPDSCLYPDEEEVISTIGEESDTGGVQRSSFHAQSWSQPGDAVSERLLPPFLYNAVVGIEQFANLPKNWDSYDADAISSQAIQRAIQVVQKTHELFEPLDERITPYVTAPMSDGGVQLEWRGPSSEIEVEISPDGQLAYLLIQGHGPNRRFFEAEQVRMAEVMEKVGRVLAK